MAELQNISLGAAGRAETGESVNSLRAKGFIPAVLYGHNTSAVSLAVPLSMFDKVYRLAGESTIIDLKVDEGAPVKVLIHDIQRHGTRGDVMHIDFYKVNMAEKLKATVPLKYVGESAAVKELGGTLVHPLNEVEVESLPMDLPHEIEVNVSILKTFEDVIRVQDLRVDRSKVEILAEQDAVVTLVEKPRTAEELAELEAAPTEVDVTKVEGVEKAPEEAPAEQTAENKE